MENTAYKVATTEGELTNINKCVIENDGTMSKVLWYIVAPEIVIGAQIRLIRSCWISANFGPLCSIPHQL